MTYYKFPIIIGLFLNVLGFPNVSKSLKDCECENNIQKCSEGRRHSLPQWNWSVIIKIKTELRNVKLMIQKVSHHYSEVDRWLV